jgi:hypothetical protein
MFFRGDCSARIFLSKGLHKAARLIIMWRLLQKAKAEAEATSSEPNTVRDQDLEE